MTGAVRTYQLISLPILTDDLKGTAAQDFMKYFILCILLMRLYSPNKLNKLRIFINKSALYMYNGQANLMEQLLRKSNGQI